VTADSKRGRAKRLVHLPKQRIRRARQRPRSKDLSVSTSHFSTEIISDETDVLSQNVSILVRRQSSSIALDVSDASHAAVAWRSPRTHGHYWEASHWGAVRSYQQCRYCSTLLDRHSTKNKIGKPCRPQRITSNGNHTKACCGMSQTVTQVAA
jgi:hypothetical protein